MNRKENLRIVGGILAIILVFFVVYFALTWISNFEIWHGVPRLILILLPLIGGWGLATVAGKNLLEGKRSLAVATVSLLLIISLSYLGGFPFLKNIGPGSDSPGGNIPDNENLSGTEHTLFKYKASFQYLSSADNGPIEKDLFLVFPCPNLGNKPALSEDNLFWQLWASEEENGENILYLEMENSIGKKFISPRKRSPDFLPPFLENTSHGPKIWIQFHSGFPKPENALYKGERVVIIGKFSVQENKTDYLRISNDKGEIWASIAGYSKNEFMEINGRVQVNLSEKENGKFETISNYIGTEWKLLPNKWEGFRLDN